MIKGNAIYLRPLVVDDASDKYRQWLLDPAVNAYLECRWSSPTLSDLRDYIKTMASSANNYLFGVFEEKNNTHIGNVKIGEVSDVHSHADIGIIIGAPEGRGKGYGAEAVCLACHYAFTELNLRKVVAGMYADNTASIAAFSKAGFTQTGIMKKHYLSNGKFVDAVLMELFSDEMEAQ